MGHSQTFRWCSALIFTAVQILGQKLPSSFPHKYPGIPNTRGDFSDSAAWQKYFEVTTALTNISFSLTRSFAGNIPVNRQGHENNTLFFWAFEKTNGSLTSNKNEEDPWVIWLNGGPGSSSLLGLLLENGPIHFNFDSSAFFNNYSWSTLADVIWIDQPVGTGFSTSDAKGYVADEVQMADDFFGFLSNLVQVFPSLAKRPLYLTGESYAGVYIPYLTKSYFSLAHPPVTLRKISMGDGLYGDTNALIGVPVISVLETYPQLIGYDVDVFEYFKEQAHLCKMDINLTYPQNGTIPPIISQPGAIQGGPGSHIAAARILFNALTRDARTLGESFTKKGLIPRHDEDTRRAWKRDLSGRANGTIDPWYGCLLWDEMIDYALNFSIPWKGNDGNGFDVYYIPDALDLEAPPTTDSVGSFLNDAHVVAAIHAPTSKSWISSFTAQQGYPFGNGFNGGLPPAEFFSELASNLSAHDIKWIFYSGNADALLPPFGTEITIQNTTFGGIQGFTQKPATPWFDVLGNFAGKIHQERNLTYALFAGSGHLVPEIKPIAAFTFLKEFILGDNDLGTVLGNGTVVGGTNTTLDGVIPQANDPIFMGNGTTQVTYFFPSATVAAWNSFTQAATAGPKRSGGAFPTAGWPLPAHFLGTILSSFFLTMFV